MNPYDEQPHDPTWSAELAYQATAYLRRRYTRRLRIARLLRAADRLGWVVLALAVAYVAAHVIAWIVRTA